MSASERTEALAEHIGATLGEHAIVSEWRSGVDFFADKVVTDDGIYVVKSPRNETLSTAYDGVVRFGDVLAREAEALNQLKFEGVPVPDVIASHYAKGAGDRSWLLLSMINHDPAAAIPTAQLGALTREIHRIEPALELLSPPEDWAAYAWTRVIHRLRAVQAYVSVPDEAVLESAVMPLLRARNGSAKSLMHMDLRLGNVCVKDGHIVALIDLANVIVGDPLFELARLRAYGHLDAEFVEGYGAADSWSRDRETLMNFYELDTSALLTVVAVEEINDAELHREQAQRTRHLLAGFVDQQC